uniref:VWFA domain-containing protein n=1 Tax=Globisporangium ultimum (strain ATCC 200006 / CBS 805.95 / DAOM BR144) TaxID=431595 RepID=K3WFT8_GLOUD
MRFRFCPAYDRVGPLHEIDGFSISSMLEVRVHFRDGRTSYGASLRAANEVISRNDFAKFKPILVFFSDGYPRDSDFTDLARYIE